MSFAYLLISWFQNANCKPSKAPSVIEVKKNIDPDNRQKKITKQFLWARNENRLAICMNAIAMLQWFPTDILIDIYEESVIVGMIVDYILSDCTRIRKQISP